MLPSLARAREARTLASTAAGFATALALVGAPLVLVALFASDRLAEVLTGDGSRGGARSLRERAAVGRSRGGRAPLHRSGGEHVRGARRLRHAGRRVCGRQRCRPRLHRHAHRLGRDRRRVARDGGRGGVGARSSRWSCWRGERIGPRCRRRRRGPLASLCGIAWGCFSRRQRSRSSLQLAYVVSIPFAGRLGSGAVTSFGYAYLAATTRRRHHRVLDRARLVGAAVSHRAHAGCGRPARRRCIVGRPGDRRGGGRCARPRGRRARGGLPRSRLRRRGGRRGGGAHRRFLRVDGGRRRRERHVPARVRHRPAAGAPVDRRRRARGSAAACLDRCGALRAGRPCGLPRALDARSCSPRS